MSPTTAATTAATTPEAAPGTATGTAADQVLALLVWSRDRLAPGPHRTQIEQIVDRLQGPLRVAIAGRVKAGKSTLLNALVGERLAPTDAGECTRLVSRYHHGPSYQVAAHLDDGGVQQLPFRRDDGALRVQLGSLPEARIRALDIAWPSSALSALTLIDTPGLASINDENSRRTRDFLEPQREQAPEADAVIYLMRHLHKSDVAFLDAFMDRSVASSSPVNSVALLSRADEIGAGRLDAMTSAARIAERYRTNAQVRGLAANVLPVAGLLAETGLTLREDEAAAVRTVAGEPDEVIDDMLLSAEQFCDPESGQLTVEIRRNLLDRLGLYGVRLLVADVRAGRLATASEMAPRLVEASGLQSLRQVLDEHFLPRARILQARTALAATRSLVPHLRVFEPRVADDLERGAERIAASAVEFARLRAANLVASDELRITDGEREELHRLFLSPTAARALGIEGSAPAEAVQAAALATIQRWRDRANDPLADAATVEVCEAAARTGESYYVQFARSA